MHGDRWNNNKIYITKIKTGTIVHLTTVPYSCVTIVPAGDMSTFDLKLKNAFKKKPLCILREN